MNILFISNNRLGDAILSSCILNQLSQQYPTAQFTIVTGRIPAQLFESLPNLKRLIIIKKQKYNLHWLKLWSKCICHYWNIIIDCRGSAISLLLPTAKRFFKYPAETKHIHRVERYTKLIKKNTLLAPRIWIGDNFQQQANALMPHKATVIAIGPAANWHAKSWPADCFIELIQKLRATDGLFPNAYIAIIAAPNERQQVQTILDSIPDEYLIDLVGTQHLLTIAACIKQSTLYIGNDSGLMHLAAAVETPTIGLFGPSDLRKYRPFGPHCQIVTTPKSLKELTSDPDYHASTTGNLMYGITVQNVLDKVKATFKTAATI